MAIQPADFLVSLSPDTIKVVLGTTGGANLSFSNTSGTERGYNLEVQVILPDGVSLDSASIAPSSIVPGPGGTLIITWLSLTDLAPNQSDYGVELILKSDEIFRDTGLPVPFDIHLVDVEVSGTVDTLPRGDDDDDNVKITKTDASDFVPLRYNLTKSAPEKITKGAGELDPVVLPFWDYQYTLTLTNNSVAASVVTLLDELANGIRYLNNLNVVGPDSGSLLSPTIITPDSSSSPLCQDFVSIDWGTVTLSPSSVNIITFDAAIWNNYTLDCLENSGDRIPHDTSLENIATLDGQSGEIEAEVMTDALDVLINKSVGSGITDVGATNFYTLNYSINQYDNVDGIVVTDIIGDGQSYTLGSASITPDSITSALGITTLVWNIGSMLASTSGVITFETVVDATYFNGDMVSAGDTLTNDSAINGTNQTTGTLTPDSSGVTVEIITPTITKEILGYYYKDGTAKSYDVASPEDEIEFLITYSSLGLTSDQMNVQIDEYAPLNMGPLVDTIPVTYGGTLGTTFTPVTVTPNGLRWLLGDVPGNSLWTAQFKVPVDDIVFVGTRKNLAKLSLENSMGLGYSARSMVDVDFGEPNIQFDKTVSGPNVNNIKFGEIYTYSIVIANPQNSENTVTDAFEMDLTDVIPTGLTYNGTYTITGTGTYTTPVFSGQNVSLTVEQLAPDETLTFNYDVLVGMVVSGKNYINEAILQRPYSQADGFFQYPGDPFEDSVTLRTRAVTLAKAVSPAIAKIGDLVTYTITVTVPLGTIAYNVQVTDFFPNATQEYQVGSATKDGSPITPSSVIGGVVTFPLVASVNATSSEQIVIYTFQVRITDADHVPPYEETQEDRARLTWTDAGGTPVRTLNVYEDVIVRTPNVIGLKEQRNVTQGGVFTVAPLIYEVGDVIEYRISLENNGEETAYNTVLTDVIDPFLQIIVSSLSATAGTPTAAGDTITWNIPTIAVSNTETLIFSVDTLDGVAPGQRIFNSATFEYGTNDNGFGITYGPETTNIVEIDAQSLGINKDADIKYAVIGEIITYTVVITIPKGIIVYNLQLTDIIPDGQQYIGNATLNSVPISGILSDATVSFPIILVIDAMQGTITLTYTFQAEITDVQLGPVTDQINKATANWYITPTVPGNPVSDDVVIMATCNNIFLKKMQKICGTCCEFTKADICLKDDSLVKYSLKITNCCPFPIYNIKIEDILPKGAGFNSIVSICAGRLSYKKFENGGLVTWYIDKLGSLDSYTVVFSIKVFQGAEERISNNAIAEYSPVPSYPRRFIVESNKVILKNMYSKTIENLDITQASCGNSCCMKIIYDSKMLK